MYVTGFAVETFLMATTLKFHEDIVKDVLERLVKVNTWAPVKGKDHVFAILTGKKNKIALVVDCSDRNSARIVTAYRFVKNWEYKRDVVNVFCTLCHNGFMSSVTGLCYMCEGNVFDTLDFDEVEGCAV